ncbi:unnamed protein product, partial [Toxocara canis]|uniref:Uncharacterized protein n=1 Tax=Toxocara canis TaxID=6265 RepID=A0A183U2T4_TOXCA
MRTESDKQKGELEALKAISQQSASLEKELSAIRAEREATIMKLKITLSEAEAKYDSLQYFFF